MQTWWHYLILVNLYLVLFYSFYRLLLSRETFFQLNRVYLVSAALFSFLIPMMQADWVHNLFITQKVQQTINLVGPGFIYEVSPMQSQLTTGQIITGIYVAGAAFLLLRLLLRLVSMKKVFSSVEAGAAYSFFKKLKVDEALPDKQIITRHEEVHASQWHSADVLLIEAIAIITWFNPVVYLYRKGIKHVHEFIADRKALEAGTDKAAYAMLLLTQTFGEVPNNLTNNFFNHSLLKQRIMMLNQNPSNRRALLKYGLTAPLFILMLILSAATVSNSEVLKTLDKKTDSALNKDFIGSKNESEATAAHPFIYERSSQKLMSTDSIPTGPIFTAVQHPPEFPGGIAKFYEYLAANIKYPVKAKQRNVQGRVIAQYVVEQDGSLSTFKILRDPGNGLGDEALRVLTLSPKWVPGVQNGRPVRVQYTVPVNFSLDTTQKYGNARIDSIVKNGHLGVYTVFTPPGKEVDSSATGKKAAKPLYILDGKEIPDINKIDPRTIESVSVLKDKSATAIYGDKGKNGVVIITLKKDKSGDKN